MEGVGVPLLPLTEPEVAPVVPCPIGAHGVVGDMGTAALVADDGAVSFLCWPSFDSLSVFATLLDPSRGGVWTLAPVLDVAHGRQMYVPDTNVLLTRWLTPEGAAEVADFMPFPEPGGRPRLVRRARAMHGWVRFFLRCAPRLDYGRTRTRAEEDANGVVFRAEGAAALRLVGSVELHTALVHFDDLRGGRMLFLLWFEHPDAAQAQRRSPSPHPEDVVQGAELADL